MTLPEHTETITDGALGFTGEPTDDVLAMVGPASSGSANTVYAFSDPKDLIATMGYGQGVEAAAWHLYYKRGTILFVKPTLSVAGSSTVPGGGTGPAVTLTGTPNDDFGGKVKITKAGVLGTSTFQYSLDGGDTYSGDIATAATYAPPNSGLTLNFAAGSYVLNDVYSWTSTGPMYSTTNFGTAFDALMADSRAFSLLHQVGSPGGATDTDKATAWAGFAAAVQTKLDAAFTTYHRFIRAFCDGADIADDGTGDALILAAFVAVSAARVNTNAGFCELASQVTNGRVYKRPATWAVAAQTRAVKVGRDPARVCGNSSSAEPLKGIVRLYHDENLRNTLDGSRLGTLRTFTEGPTGFYVTNAPLLSPVGSDFKYVQHGRVLDKACRVVRPEMLKTLSDETRYYGSPPPTGKTAGQIYEQDAIDIEKRVGRQLNSQLVATQNAQSATVEINRTDIVATTGKVRAKVRVKPYLYPKTLETELGFEAL